MRSPCLSETTGTSSCSTALTPPDKFVLRLLKLSGDIPRPVEDAEDLERLCGRFVDDGVVLMNSEKPDRFVR